MSQPKTIQELLDAAGYVLTASVEKVKGRIARGTLRGAGDDR